MNAPDELRTQRLILRRPVKEDAAHIFSRYARDPEVTRYLSWPRHTSIADTYSFLAFSEAQWQRWAAGPYLIETRETQELIGSAGLDFINEHEAMTGYVLARDAWGNGYATEALQAVVDLARSLGVHTVYALCHPNHRASQHVLSKSGFVRVESANDVGAFPQLGESVPVLRFKCTLKQKEEDQDEHD